MSHTMIFALIAVGALLVLLGLLRLRHVSLDRLIFGVSGAVIGLLLGALASIPLSKLPAPFGAVLPLSTTTVLTIAMLIVILSQRQALLRAMPFLNISDAPAPASPAPNAAGRLPRILVDTSAIIDGRIADVAAAGFMPGRLVVPRFVLAELQNIADSDDAMRRGRGRRGLDVLQNLRDMPDLEVEIIEDDVQGVKEVDAKLVALGQKFSCNVLTTDYNLNRVAQIQGVRVLNVNELANAIRPVVIPGEEMIVKVVQPGKERNQGVGYLADGTMIVVENGDKLIGQEVVTEVTRVFQTVAGKMIFAAPKGGKTVNEPRPESKPDPKPQPPQVTPTPAVHMDSQQAPATPDSAPERQARPEATDAPGGNRGRRGGRGRFGRGGGQSNRTHEDAAAPTSPVPATKPTVRQGQTQPPRTGGRGGASDIESRIVAANRPQDASQARQPRPPRPERPRSEG